MIAAYVAQDLILAGPLVFACQIEKRYNSLAAVVALICLYTVGLETWTFDNLGNSWFQRFPSWIQHTRLLCRR